jgi:nitronate monooxygenase
VGFDCLASCGLRDGIAKHGQFCIDTQLAFALAGDINRGLFFRGSEKLPFGNAIRTVRELIDYLLNGVKPATAAINAPTVRREAEPALV